MDGVLIDSYAVHFASWRRLAPADLVMDCLAEVGFGRFRELIDHV